jgi:hypothetical protein
MLAKLAVSLPPVTFQVLSSSLGNKVITLRILFIDLIRQPYRARIAETESAVHPDYGEKWHRVI